MKTKRNLTIIFLIISTLTIVFNTIAYGNSAEPPGITIIVKNPPEDLELYIKLNSNTETKEIKLEKYKKSWETYYRFYYYGLGVGTEIQFENSIISAKSSEKNFECKIPPETYTRYNNFLTLDFNNETLSFGTSLLRTPILILMRLFLTLIIEGIIFLAFGYRQKFSWIVFLIINIITQGGLNILISGPGVGSYWLIGYVLGESLILIIEITVFLILLKEHSKLRALFYTIFANFASLIIGGAFISNFPI